MQDLNQGTASLRTGRFRYGITTCGVVYEPFRPPPPPEPVASALSASALAGIIVGASLLVILLVTGALFASQFIFGRANRYAPKDPSLPFAIVFTDIQNSTGLWARNPVAMSKSVSLHHDLIRSLIRQHRGYEVKTIGDSFMIAFADVTEATHLATELQTLFYKSKWPADIDATYAELLSEAELVVDPPAGLDVE